MLWIIGIGVWLLCGAAAYIVLKSLFRREMGEWTTGDRALGLMFGLSGPVALIVSLVVTVVFCLCSCDKPAKW